MRTSENLSAYGGVRGQGGRPKMLEGVVFSTLRTFLAGNAGIGLPLGIERVIWIGSKSPLSESESLHVVGRDPVACPSKY